MNVNQVNKIVRRRKANTGGSPSGFTLVELLVTILLTSIMGLFVVQTLLFVTERSQTSIQQAHTTDEIALIAQTLEKDIASASDIAYEANSSASLTIQLINYVADTIRYEIDNGLLTRNGFLLHDEDVHIDSLVIDMTESRSREFVAKSFSIYYAVKGESHVSKHISIKSN
jgi:prepilin-type N-terminal cleavage/methylation domain-containing protein